MQRRGILVHYAELGTKGQNKKSFIKRLVDDVRRALDGCDVDFESGRLWVTRQGRDVGEAELQALELVPGIANFAPAVLVPLELAAMQEAALGLVQGRAYASFRVRAKRVYKELRFGSLEVDHEVGAFLQLHKPAEVRMKGAELEVYIEMLPHGAFVYTDRRRGLGGLPIGTGGTVACLMSGGIDSPVAAFRMMRRGCRVVLIHFHSHPFLSKASAEKAAELAGSLSRIAGRLTLYLVPFGELQREIVVTCPDRLRVVLYRRFMLRLAGSVAAQHGAKALITGESLGQVASQTLANLTVIDEAAPLTVLRPLVGFDKQEIIDEARRLGTFDISIQPDQDCCTLFVPKHAETHARLPEVLEAEARLDVAGLMQEALARVERHEILPPAAEPPVVAALAQGPS